MAHLDGPRRLDRLIVTRPAPDAGVWAEALREKGWPAQALPLIQIGEPETPAERDGLRHWRAHWSQADAILFVSGAAVSHFFAAGVAPPVGAVHTRFWAPGPGTARALAHALAHLGIAGEQIDAPAPDAAQFDSEHLWPQVAAQVGPGRRVLIVRGSAPASSRKETATPDVAGSGRDWLIRRCRAAGAHVEGCAAYARHAPVLSFTEQELIRSATTEGSAWLFSSSEALAPLRALAPAPDWALASALVTHPRIGEAAVHAGFGHVVATRPTLADVLRTLESDWYRP